MESNLQNIEALVFASTPNRDKDMLDPLTSMNPVHGRPSLDWVVTALRSCPSICKVTVIGPDILDELLCMRQVDRRISGSLTIQTIQNTIFNNNDSPSNHSYLVVPGDVVLLQPEEIINFLSQVVPTDNSISLPIVSPNEINSVNINSRIIQIDGEPKIIGCIAHVKRIQDVLAALMRISQTNDNKYSILSGTGLLFNTVANINALIASVQFSYIPFISIGPYTRILSNEMIEKSSSMAQSTIKPLFTKAKMIINPHSGLGPELPGFLRKMLGIKKRKPIGIKTSKDLIERITSILKEFGITVEVQLTKSAKHATAIACKCAQDNCELLIAAGGDGTINAVVNGLAGSNTAMATIPLGTVNVFALQYAIPMEIRSACQLIASGKITRIDLAKAKSRLFSSIAGIGYDAYVINRAQTKIKKILGAATYSILGITTLFGYTFRTIKFTLDDIVEETGYLVIIGNGKYYSANLIIAEQADPTDGLLDVVIFKGKDFPSLLSYIRKGLQAKGMNELPNVLYRRVKKITINRHGRHYVHVDGENIGRTPVTIEIIPSSLSIIS